ncbi:MAG: RluA family pseudouridine synthase [Clostridia bacterium]
MVGEVFNVEKANEGERIDVFVAHSAEFITRAHAQKLIDGGYVLINGIVCKSKKIVKENDIIDIEFPLPVEIDIKPQDIPIDIVYEDSELAVINKQQGLTVHPANGVYTDTLVNALLFRFKDLSGINGAIRPGIVHRLDKDTSGLMLVAKTDRAHNLLAQEIATKECKRVYYALLEGIIKEDEGFIDEPIGRNPKDRKQMAVVSNGRSAQTAWTIVKRYRNNTLVRFELKTGRTHQIRVHSKFIGHCVVGDKVYGFKNQRFKLEGQLLHSKEITFRHPNGEIMYFESELPDYFKKVLDILDKTDKIN